MRQGLKPDKLTYNTLIFACVKSGKTDTAIQFLCEMKVSSKCLGGYFKPMWVFSDVFTELQIEWPNSYVIFQEEASKVNCNDLLPDAVTYTTLLKVTYGALYGRAPLVYIISCIFQIYNQCEWMHIWYAFLCSWKVNIIPLGDSCLCF